MHLNQSPCPYHNIFLSYSDHHLCSLTSGLEKDVKGLIDNTGRGGVSVEDDASARQLDVEHVMLSYEWGCQQSVLLIKSELEKAGT